jgi:UDP-glucuronate 4-epimerase
MILKKFFITGSAGFIGFHVARKLLDIGNEVIGYDSINDYYDTNLKESRIEILKRYKTFQFVKADLCESKKLEAIFDNEQFEAVIHLAAQAGVRYSLENPRAYVDSNIVGFVNILECCRKYHVKHLIYASSSSVYGLNTKLPFSENDSVDHPASLYAATKKSNELMAHTYSHLFGLPTTGLRFFTVYGPWGRPDMAIFKFTKSILEGKPIDVYNNGNMKRDFTYIDDIVNGIVRVVDVVPKNNPENDYSNPATSKSPFRIFNIGNNKSVELMNVISILETILGKKAIINFLPMQAGDVLETYADISSLHETVDFQPVTDIETGIRRFVEWFRTYNI